MAILIPERTDENELLYAQAWVAALRDILWPFLEAARDQKTLADAPDDNQRVSLDLPAGAVRRLREGLTGEGVLPILGTLAALAEKGIVDVPNDVGHDFLARYRALEEAVEPFARVAVTFETYDPEGDDDATVGLLLACPHGWIIRTVQRKTMRRACELSRHRLLLPGEDWIAPR